MNLSNRMLTDTKFSGTGLSDLKLSDIETPALVLDLDILEENMSVMQSFLDGHPVKLRPHFKTSKCVEIVKRQLAKGAKGITCSKLSEAGILVEAGVPDILIANEIVQKSKIERAAGYAKKTRLTLCADQKQNILDLNEAAEKAGSTIHIYIEFDVGMNRCGVSTYEAFYELAKLVSECPNLRFEGIQAYAGQLSHEENVAYKKEQILAVEKKLTGLKQYVEDRGIKVNQISGGSTNTSLLKAGHGVYTELQAGSYVYMDAAFKNCSLPYQNSLFLLTTVISRSPDRIILDAGAKGLGLDQVLPVCRGYETYKYVVSEEHFGIYGSDLHAKIGDQVWMIPGHCCTTVNLYPQMYVKRGDRIVDIWKVEGSLKSV